jgi:hypothetical protein
MEWEGSMWRERNMAREGVVEMHTLHGVRLYNIVNYNYNYYKSP